MISSEKKRKANRLTNGSKNDTVDHPKSANGDRHKWQAGMEIKQKSATKKEYKLKKLTCYVQVMQHILELLVILVLHDEGSDRVGHAHDAQERYGGAQLLVGVDEVEGLLCAPLHPKTEKEGEEGQHSCVHHLE